MPALTYAILGGGSYITKIDGSSSVSDLMKQIKASEDSPEIRGRWADLQLYTTRGIHQDQPGRFFRTAEAHRCELPWDKRQGQWLRRFETFTPRRLRMKTTQRIDFYFPDVGERMNDADVHVLVVLPSSSAFHGSSREISMASDVRDCLKREREYKERVDRAKLARRQQAD